MLNFKKKSIKIAKGKGDEYASTEELLKDKLNTNAFKKLLFSYF